MDTSETSIEPAGSQNEPPRANLRAELECTMLVVTVEFALREGAEPEFLAALKVMQARVRSFDGFLGEEPCQSVSDPNHQVTLSYWRDAESMAAWRVDPEHMRIQKRGREEFFRWYRIHIARVEREYDWNLSDH